MPREHSDIKMPPEVLAAFLCTDKRLILATNDEDGGNWADAVAYCFVDGRVYFRVPTDTRSYRNIAADPRVCCVVESKPAASSYYDIKGAMLHGRAEPLGDGAIGAQVRAALADIDDPVEPSLPHDGAVFSVGLDDSTSFDFSRIRYRYQDRPLTDDGIATLTK